MSNFSGFIVLSTIDTIFTAMCIMKIGIEQEQVLEETPRLHPVALASSGQGLI
jgi:hypothetical protein